MIKTPQIVECHSQPRRRTQPPCNGQSLTETNHCFIEMTETNEHRAKILQRVDHIIWATKLAIQRQDFSQCSNPFTQAPKPNVSLPDIALGIHALHHII